jgi:hypothetical protein
MDCRPEAQNEGSLRGCLAIARQNRVGKTEARGASACARQDKRKVARQDGVGDFLNSP